MVGRRGPRWMFWPAKLLWVPLTVAGFWMAFVTEAAVDPIEAGAFRVGLRFFEPAGWSASPILHAVGVAVFLAGVVFFWLYVWNPGPDRRGVIEEFPLYTLAAWAFLAVAVGAALRWTGHVWDFGVDGVTWRFLVEVRSHPADRTVAVLAALGALVCVVLSYGRSYYGRLWSTRPEAPQAPDAIEAA